MIQHWPITKGKYNMKISEKKLIRLIVYYWSPIIDHIILLINIVLTGLLTMICGGLPLLLAWLITSVLVTGFRPEGVCIYTTWGMDLADPRWPVPELVEFGNCSWMALLLLLGTCTTGFGPIWTPTPGLLNLIWTLLVSVMGIWGAINILCSELLGCAGSWIEELCIGWAIVDMGIWMFWFKLSAMETCIGFQSSIEVLIELMFMLDGVLLEDSCNGIAMLKFVQFPGNWTGSRDSWTG